jgi:hypothetical protein
VVRQIWWTRQIIYFFQILDTGCHWTFAHCHVASHNWATWQPPIRPCHPLLCQPTMSVPCHCTDTMSLPTHHATSLYRPYGLPRGKILLVRGSVQKCQKWVTRGSLWCWYITMLASCRNHLMTHVTSCSYHVCCTDANVSSTDADSSPY